MTKVVKIWKRFGFWSKIRAVLATIGTGGEITLFLMDSYPRWKIIAGIATFLGVGITYLFTDKNKNDIVDIFEKK